MPARIDVWTDFTCPFCFLAALGIERVQREWIVDVHWRTLMLRRPGSGPIPAAERAAAGEQRQRVSERIQIEYGIELSPGPIGIGTCASHLAIKYARQRRKSGELHAALMRGYWLEGRSIGEPEVIGQLAAEINLDAADLLAKLKDPVYAEAVVADLRRARNVGVRAAPALLFGNKFLVSNALSYQVWISLLRRLQVREKRNSYRYIMHAARSKRRTRAGLRCSFRRCEAD